MKKSSKAALWMISGVFGIAVIAIATSSPSSQSPASSPTSAASSPATVASSPAAPAPSPTTAAKVPAQVAAAKSAPAMTPSQQQAVDAAQQYLSMGNGFSRQGLIQQLTSSAGDGFPTSDATFAVNYLHPDWDAQAVLSAKGYLQMGGFSASSLLQQLTSSAGDGYTYAQASYAVHAVGL